MVRPSGRRFPAALALTAIMANPDKHFVFTMTAGRTGTHYLTELLRRNLDDVEGRRQGDEHERIRESW